MNATSLTMLRAGDIDYRPCFWSIVSISAWDSVSYLRSDLASSAAAQYVCSSFLALVRPSNPEDLETNHVSVFPVQRASADSLPQTFVPIAPCSVGDRQALDPGPNFPGFLRGADFLIDTSPRITLVGLCEAGFDPDRHSLSHEATQYFRSIELADRHVHEKISAAASRFDEDDDLSSALRSYHPFAFYGSSLPRVHVKLGWNEVDLVEDLFVQTADFLEDIRTVDECVSSVCAFPLFS